MNAAEWNAKNGIGTEVVLGPWFGPIAGVITNTTSEAWMLGGHTPVVQLADHNGCVNIGYLEVLNAAKPSQIEPSTKDLEEMRGLVSSAMQSPPPLRLANPQEKSIMDMFKESMAAEGKTLGGDI